MYFSTTNNIHEVITKQEALKIEGKVRFGRCKFDIVGSTSSENVGNLFNINNFSDNGSGYNSRSGSGRDNCADRSSRDNSADRSGGRFGDNNPANGGRFRGRTIRDNSAGNR